MDDDDPPQLSAEALAALQEFYAERALEEQAAQDPTSVESKMPEEDWQLSQFWYDELTSEMLAKEALAVAGSTGRIACLSCPTMYNKLRQIKPETCSAVILEYDQRFSKYGEDFIFYDYNNPLDLPKELESSFDIVVADPPFLSEECLKKTAKTISFLSKGKILLCTGGTMEDLAFSVLNVKVCAFQPKHSRNLANEFKCYTNYSPLVLGSA